MKPNQIIGHVINAVIVLSLAGWIESRAQLHNRERFAEQQREIEAARAEIKRLKDGIGEVADALHDIKRLAGNSKAGLVEMRSLMETMKTDSDNQYTTILDLISKIGQTRRAATAAASPPPASMAPRRPKPQEYRDGVPVDVYNQIAASAALKWPGNFDMQKYEMDKQILAYRQIHP